MAIARLKEAGATIERLNFRIEGFPVDAQVSGSNGRPFLVLARGTPDEQDRSALRRTDTVEKAGFMAMQLARRQALPIILITSDLPKRSTRAGHYLAALSDDLWDVVSYRSDLKGFQRLRAHFTAPIEKVPPTAPWRAPEKISSPTLLDEFTDVDAHRAHRPASRQTWTSAPSSQDRATDRVRPTLTFDGKNDSRRGHQRFPQCPVKTRKDTPEYLYFLGVPPRPADLRFRGGGERTRTVGLYIANVWLSAF